MSKIRVKQLDEVELTDFVESIVSGDLSSLESGINSIQNDQDTLSGFYTDLVYSVGILSGQNSGISGRLNVIESDFAAFDVDLSILSGDITTLEVATGVLYTYIQDIELELSGIQSGNINSFSGISGTLSGISGSISGLSGSVQDIRNTFLDYIHIQDIKAFGVSGGVFNSGAWRTRDLNTIVSNSGNLCSLSSNQIALSGGLYISHISVPIGGINSHISRLYNISNSSTLLSGTQEFTSYSRSFINGQFRITGNTGQLVEVQHYTTSSSVNTDGFGAPFLSNIGVQNIYTDAQFWRISD